MQHIRLDSLVRNAGAYRQQNPHIRNGQALMTILYEWEPELYKEVTNSPVDPFFNDDLIPVFLDWLKPRLPEYSSACSHTGSTPKCAACRTK